MKAKGGLGGRQPVHMCWSRQYTADWAGQLRLLMVSPLSAPLTFLAGLLVPLLWLGWLLGGSGKAVGSSRVGSGYISLRLPARAPKPLSLLGPLPDFFLLDSCNSPCPPPPRQAYGVVRAPLQLAW